jgi:isoquinoline 1-oxidoreductase
VRLRFQPAASPVPQGSYRALAATANAFARECHIDELAEQADVDPVDFRLANLDDERLSSVIRAAAERFGWNEELSGSGRGFGFAAGLEKGGRVATAAEVTVGGDGKVTIRRIVTSYECGAVVNRDTVMNQIEGGTIMALGGTLFEEVALEHGHIASPTLSHYRIPRFSDIPDIDIVLLDRPDIPFAGAGETPLITVAPAIANAIHSASGVRLRSLPLIPNGRIA